MALKPSGETGAWCIVDAKQILVERLNEQRLEGGSGQQGGC